MFKSIFGAKSASCRRTIPSSLDVTSAKASVSPKNCLSQLHLFAKGKWAMAAWTPDCLQQDSPASEGTICRFYSKTLFLQKSVKEFE